VFQLIYTSKEFRPMSDADLKRIVSRSQIRNRQDGITGFLYYSAGTFLQILEGEEATVRATFARIEDDFRHTISSVLFEGTVEERLFSDWSMEAADPKKTSAIMHAFFQSDRDLDLTKLDEEKAMLLLDAFSVTNKALLL